MKKVLSIAICLILACTFLASCGEPAEELPPEVGKWKGEIKLSELDINVQVPDEIKGAYDTVAGFIGFDVVVEFTKDGAFNYEIDVDKIVDDLTNRINGIIGIFIKVDVSGFVKSLTNTIRDQVFNGKLEYAGPYTVKDGKITATDGEALRFEVFGNVLIQYNDDGTEFLRFKKVDK